MGLSEIHPLNLKWVDNNFVGATKTKSIFADELRFPISVISSMFVTMEWDITAWFVTQCQIFVIYWILSSSPSRHKITPRDCPWSLAPGEYQRWIECCLLPPPLLLTPGTRNSGYDLMMAALMRCSSVSPGRPGPVSCFNEMYSSQGISRIVNIKLIPKCVTKEYKRKEQLKGSFLHENSMKRLLDLFVLSTVL